MPQETSCRHPLPFKMNAKTRSFHFKIECHNVFEIVSCLFHTILFLRSQGKFWHSGNGYVESPLHFEDMDLSFLELTYVRSKSSDLKKCVDESIVKFIKELRKCSEPKTGKISLEFYRLQRNSMPFTSRHVVWELWTIHVEVVEFKSVRTVLLNNILLLDQITDAILHIVENVNVDSSYVSTFSHCEEINLIYDLSFRDVQPFLFKISHETKLSDVPILKAVKRLFDALF